MYRCFMDVGIDFLEEMLSPFDNFLSFGADVFIQDPEHRRMVVDIYRFVHLTFIAVKYTLADLNVS